MPGKELGITTETESPILGSLKAHKVFPRRNIVSDGSESRMAGRNRDPLSKSLPISYTTSERIESWIPESSSVRVIPVIGRPITPPINFRDNFKSWIDDAVLRDQRFSTQSRINPGDTPLVQNSPPTPERTPPKKIHKASDSTAPTSRNVSDTHLDSFKTAREDISSDDESQQLRSPALHSTRQKWLRSSGLAEQKDVGLGLGLETEDDGPTPKRMTPVVSNKHNDFVAFDGAWGGETPARIGRDLDSTAADRKTSKHSRQRSQPYTMTTHDTPKLHVDVVPSLEKSLSLRRRVEHSRKSPVTASTENFAGQIDWPLQEQTPESVLDANEVNEKRLSQASTASTVVTAMVIGPPPQRRQTLRRTDKVCDLHATPSIRRKRDLRPDLRRDRSLRQRKQNPDKADDNLRRSFISDEQDVATIKRSVPVRNLHPPLVIPVRRSSLPSSTASSKQVSRASSVNSRQQSSRPTTAPEDTVSYFDITRRDRRAVSVVIQQARPIQPDSKMAVQTSPKFLNTISPPSMPTSNAVSRTTSATSAGMITHYLPATPLGPTSPHEAETEELQELALDRSASRPRSTQVTPFSLRSAHSSTPGTLEVNEATAMSIYPHTNKSILVIQEMASKENPHSREQSAVIAGNASIAIPGSMSPLIHQEAQPIRQLTDSPLRNPRNPPLPPDFIKIIPPTPANAPPSSDDTRIVPSTPTRGNRFSAPLTTIKRALSARRHSESFVSPFARTLSLRGSVRRQSVAVDDPESKLHPFWRPRSHGEDSDSDSEFGNEGVLSPQRSNSYRKRSLSLRRPFAGSIRSVSGRLPRRASSTSAADRSRRQQLPYELEHEQMKEGTPLKRRLTGSLRLPSSRRPRRSSTAEWVNQPDYTSVDPGEDQKPHQTLNGVKRHFTPGQLVGFRGLANRMERRRELREEKERELRRDRLKNRIGNLNPEVSDDGHAMFGGVRNRNSGSVKDVEW